MSNVLDISQIKTYNNTLYENALNSISYINIISPSLSDIDSDMDYFLIRAQL